MSQQAKKEPGRIVVVHGKRGRTKNTDQPINGKIPVYFFGEGTTPHLVKPEDITAIGFID